MVQPAIIYSKLLNILVKNNNSLYYNSATCSWFPTCSLAKKYVLQTHLKFFWCFVCRQFTFYRLTCATPVQGTNVTFIPLCLSFLILLLWSLWMFLPLAKTYRRKYLRLFLYVTSYLNHISCMTCRFVSHKCFFRDYNIECQQNFRFPL